MSDGTKKDNRFPRKTRELIRIIEKPKEEYMGQREAGKKPEQIAKRILAWMLSVLMVISVADVSGWGITTVKAQEAAGSTKKTIAVTQDGKTTEYASFEEAHSDGEWKDSCTIKLLGDTVLTKRLWLYGKTITLDLNGYTLDTGAKCYVLSGSYYNSCNLTIKNSSEEKNGKLTGNNDDDGTLEVSYGNCTIQKGVTVGNTMFRSAVLVNHGALTLEEGALLVQGRERDALHVASGSADIKGGVLDGRLSVTSGSSVKIRITGGTFQSGIVMDGKEKKVAECMAEGYCLKKADGSYYLNLDTSGISESVTAVAAPVKITGEPAIVAQKEVVLTGYKEPPRLTMQAEKQGNTESGDISYQWYLTRTLEGQAAETDIALPEMNETAYQIPTGLLPGTYTYYCRVTCGKYYVNTQSVTFTVTAGDILVRMGETETAYTALQPALAAVDEAVKADDTGDDTDVVITLKKDICIDQYSSDAVGWSVEAADTKKVNVTLDLNGKTVQYKKTGGWVPGNLKFTFYGKNAAFTLKDSAAGENGSNGKFKGYLSVKNGAGFTIENGEYDSATIDSGSKAVLKDGKCTSVVSINDASSIDSEDGGSCIISGGSYSYVNVGAGAQLAVSGSKTKINTLTAYTYNSKYSGKRAAVTLSGGSYGKVQTKVKKDEDLLDETKGYAITDMLAPGYAFYSGEDRKNVGRENVSVENVEVRLKDADTGEETEEPVVEIVFDGKEKQSFENWLNVLDYLYKHPDEVGSCKTVDIILLKDLAFSSNFNNEINFGNAKVTLRSGEGGTYTLTGTANGYIIKVGYAEDFRIENINLTKGIIDLSRGNITVKNAELIYARDKQENAQSITLERGAKVFAVCECTAIWSEENALLQIKNEKNSGESQAGGMPALTLEKETPALKFESNGFLLDIYYGKDTTSAVTDSAMVRKWFPITLSEGISLSEDTGCITRRGDQLFGCAKAQINVGAAFCSWYPTAENETGSPNIQKVTDGKITMPAAMVTLLGHKRDKEGKCNYCGEQVTAEVTAGGITNSYISLQDAVNDAKTQAGSVITLLSDHTITDGMVLELTDGVSLNIPAGKTLTNNGTIFIADQNCITGDGTLAGDGKFKMGPDFSMLMGLTYTGEDLTESVRAAISLDGKGRIVTVMGTQFFRDTDGWSYTITQDGIGVEGIRDAGDYVVGYFDDTGRMIVKKTFTVEKAEMPFDAPEDMEVANNVTTGNEVRRILLKKYSEWIVYEVSSGKIPAGGSIKVKLSYNEEDQYNYKITTKEITVTRAACEEDQTVLYTGEGEIAPTCTQAGIGHTECSICHDVMNKNISVAPVHSLTKVPAKEATEKETGNIEYYVCSVCQRYFRDEVGKNEITDKAGVVIPVKDVTPEEQAGKESTENIGQTKTAPKKKGTKFKDASGNQYKVTGSDQKNPTVEYVKPKSSAKGTIKIPATVRYDEVIYKVTSVADKAFRNNKKVMNITVGSNVTSIGKSAFEKCTKLKTVTVGKNVTKIGKNAFGGCKNLKTLSINTTKLTKKGLASGSFKGISKKTVVKVPKGKVKAYKKLLRSKGLDKKVSVK